jgi:hypothetical protein
MNYIELARAVRSRAGVQGTGPASISGASGAEADIIQAVSDAWLDIQNYRTDWKWMHDTKSFLLSADTTVYTPTTIFSTSSHRLGKWIKEAPAYLGVSGTYGMIPYIHPDRFEFLEINNTVGGAPVYYTIRINDNALVFPKPNAQYAFKITYQKSPQTLTSASDVPEMPAHFHLLIVYAALEKYSVSIGAPEVYQKYSYDYARLLGSLMRDQLPKKALSVGGIV